MSSSSRSFVVDGTQSGDYGLRRENLDIVCTIGGVIKTTFGPLAKLKVIEDEFEHRKFTNDGLTILRNLSISDHPIGNILLDLAEVQHLEIGDGTTSVVLLAVELVKHANNLASVNIPLNSIVNGFRHACNEACRYIKNNLTENVEANGREMAINAVKTALCSKPLSKGDTDFLADMAVRAAETLKIPTADGPLYPVSQINILNVRGVSIKESVLITGYALTSTVASATLPKRITDAKIACLNFSLQVELGADVVRMDPKKLEEVRQRESSITKEKIQRMLNVGANAILTTGNIDDVSLTYLANTGVMAVRKCNIEDLLRIANATGAIFLNSFDNVDASFLGQASEVSEERVCDEEIIVVRNPAYQNWSSILLRSACDSYRDELERSMLNALFAAKRVLESQKVVAGGGSIETAVSIYLENFFATSLSSFEQKTIEHYARALLVIPQLLMMNAAPSPIDWIHTIRSVHYISQTRPFFSYYKWCGLSVFEMKVCDTIKAGIVEPASMKIQSLQLATEAAISILRANCIRVKNKKSSAKDNEH